MVRTADPTRGHQNENRPQRTQGPCLLPHRTQPWPFSHSPPSVRPVRPRHRFRWFAAGAIVLYVLASLAANFWPETPPLPIISTIKPETGPEIPLAFSPDGTLLVTMTGNQGIGGPLNIREV